ncbi:hypothetical protein HKD42_05585 [Altererythrobacter sp. RZ02]|uniref:Autotransporter domain-containing protein n=1 Tax=Pontixanthobacter rizhaonensis TaxID=2730337 RepID=A0A848QN07_9SPHN|nr:hypothetical protein [Pontixanthobacter rizhaonensis]NMW31525.1 hypothetical protein [Pontixanthobacter rizhaonensis]
MKMRTAVMIAPFAAALSVSTSVKAEVVVGPRFSYYFDNSNLRTSDLEGLQDARTVVDRSLTEDLRAATGFDDLTVTTQNNGSASNSDQVGFPMVGGMVNFGDDRDRVTLIGMYGSSSTVTELVSSRTTEIEVADIGFREISIIETVTDQDIDRIDMELTWQRRLNENFAILAGVRYERLDTSGRGVVTIQETDEVRQFVADALGQNAPTRNLDGERAPQTVFTNTSLDTFSGRMGVTAFVPFGENAVAFFSGMVQGSYQPDSEFRSSFIGRNGEEVRSEIRTDTGEFSVGPDFAVGSQFVLTENLALDIRYRAILFFPLSGEFDFGDSRVNHGVNLGLSLRL